MARHEGDVITQGKKPITDGIDQLRQIAVRVLPGAYRMTKQDVADEGLPAIAAEIGNMAFTVAGAVKDLELFPPKTDRIAMLNQ